MRELNPLLHSQLRLGVMSILMNVEEADFVYLKEKTESTAGNLSVQLDKLSAAGYISVKKGFVGKKTRTTARITDNGRNAFVEYVEALKQYISM
jgi:DNA-binding MarR family transcriptional regulator